MDFLKQIVPSYNNEKNYSKNLAVVDGNLITASGSGPLEFTKEIMKKLDIYNEEKRGQWYALFKNGTPPPPEFWT